MDSACHCTCRLFPSVFQRHADTNCVHIIVRRSLFIKFYHSTAIEGVCGPWMHWLPFGCAVLSLLCNSSSKCRDIALGRSINLIHISACIFCFVTFRKDAVKDTRCTTHFPCKMRMEVAEHALRCKPPPPTDFLLLYKPFEIDTNRRE